MEEGDFEEKEEMYSGGEFSQELFYVQGGSFPIPSNSPAP